MPKPPLALGQKWRRRDSAEVVITDRRYAYYENSFHFFVQRVDSGEVVGFYRSGGFHNYEPKYDLIKLVSNWQPKPTREEMP